MSSGGSGFGISKEIKELGTTAPLITGGPGSVFRSPGIQIPSYNSLSTLIYADQSCTFNIQYSGDNVNWDQGFTTLIAPLDGQQILSPLISKYVRISITLTGEVDMVDFRVFSYGTNAAGNSSNSILDGDGNIQSIGGSGPSTSTYGEILTQSFNPKLMFTPTLINPGTIASHPGPIWHPLTNELGYDMISLSDYRLNDIPFCNVRGSRDNAAGNCLIMDDFDGRGGIIGGGGIFSGLVPFVTGVGMEARFSAAFKGGTSFLGRDRDLMVGLFDIEGNHDEGSTPSGQGPDPKSAYAFGVSYDPSVDSNGELEIIIITEVSFFDPSVRVTIPSRDWNVDKADGSGTLPLIQRDQVNSFKISMGFSGTAQVLFSIAGPEGFVVVHSFDGNRTPALDTSFPFGSSMCYRMGMHAELHHIIDDPDPTIELRMYGWALGYLGESPSKALNFPHIQTSTNFQFSRGFAIAGDHLVVSIRNPPNRGFGMGPIFDRNSTVGRINSIEVGVATAVVAGQSRVMSLDIYRQSTLSPNTGWSSLTGSDLTQAGKFEFTDDPTVRTGGRLIESLVFNSFHPLAKKMEFDPPLLLQPSVTYAFVWSTNIPSGGTMKLSININLL